MRFFLPAYLIAYVVSAFFWRSYQVKKRTGINPVTFKGSDNAHDYIGRVFKILFALIFAIVMVYAVLPGVYKFSAPIEWLERSAIRVTGIALLLLSLLWTVIAQAQMGDSWRIGVDRDHQTALVQKGVFRFSRNPIFLGMITTLLGLFLVIPNGITLLTFVLGMVVIGVQVRLEEEHLLKIHGKAYAEFCRRVRRWI